MFYDQLSAVPEESLAGNLRLPHRRRRAHNMTPLPMLGIRLQIHIQMMVILIQPVKHTLTKV